MILRSHPSADFRSPGLGRGGIGAVQQIPGLHQRLHDQGEWRLSLDGSLAQALHLLEAAKLRQKPVEPKTAWERLLAPDDD